MLAHARLPYAYKLLMHPVCATGSQLAGHNSIRKRDSHYSTGQVLRLKCPTMSQSAILNMHR
jgi:hypothetical protein